MNDEELWSRYFLAAWEQRWAQQDTKSNEVEKHVNGAANCADVMLEKHRERFPSPPKEGPFR